MSIEIVDDPVERRSVKDVKRHQEKVMDAIKKSIPDIIGNEDIITGRAGKKVRLRVKALKSFRFIFDRKYGIGTGPGDGPSDEPGDQEGEYVFDTEMELEELIRLALEECGLPNLQQKEENVSQVLEGFRVNKIRKSGVWPLLQRRRTAIEAKLRMKTYIFTLMRLTGLSEKECEKALQDNNGDFRKAYLYLMSIIGRNAVPSEMEDAAQSAEKEAEEKAKKIFFRDEDLRFREVEEKFEEQSNAIVYAIRDASGSMDTEKKFLSRMLLFWLVSALRMLYQNVEIKFILHTTSADFYPENEFFLMSESGGTIAASGYELAKKDIDTSHPTDRWNVYAFHFSDGDDFEPERAVAEALKMMEMGINMFGYGEIIPSSYGSSLMKAFMSKIRHSAQHNSDYKIITSVEKDKPFLAASFSNKQHLYPILKEFLKKERQEWTR